MKHFEAVESKHSLWPGERRRKPFLAQQLLVAGYELVVAAAVIDGDAMGTRYVKHNEILRAVLRERAVRTSRMTELIAKAQVLKSVLFEKFAVPSL